MPVTALSHHATRLAVFLVYNHVTFEQVAACFETFARKADYEPDYNEIILIESKAIHGPELVPQISGLLDLMKTHLQDAPLRHPAQVQLRREPRDRRRMGRARPAGPARRARRNRRRRPGAGLDPGGVPVGRATGQRIGRRRTLRDAVVPTAPQGEEKGRLWPESKSGQRHTQTTRNRSRIPGSQVVVAC